ncbi:MAG: DUF4258 domain-containing protein [Clostridia bacterium]|nr:DUF4258 domain-containing protein [Clostridia bacterium]
MNVSELRALCDDETIVISQHCLKRIIERGIEIEQVKQAILCGEIIEDYPTDYPYPSCLVLGNGLHVVAGVGDGQLWLITVYIPDPAKWSADLKTRKEV